MATTAFGPWEMLLFISLLLVTFSSSGVASNAADPGVMVPVTIRPATLDQSLFVAESLEPRSNITYCSIYPSKGNELLDCITAYHDEHHYVDLEQIEPLLEDQRVLCDESAVAHRSTDVVLRFISEHALRLAQSVWGSGADILFMIEDPHCFDPDGGRSFYHSVGIDWNVTHNVAIVRATPLWADITMPASGWADRVSRGVTTVPYGSFAHARPSTGYTSKLDPTYIEEIEKRDGTGPKMALAFCIAGFLPPLTTLGGPLEALARCAIGAPLYGLMVEVVKSKETSTHIKVAFGFAHLSPLLGGVIAGIGALFAPTTLAIHQFWDHNFGGKALMIPWGIEKSDAVVNHVKLPHITFRCPNCHVFGNFSLALTIEFDLAGHRHKGPKECTNSIEEQFQLPKRSAGRMPGSGPRISHETYYELSRLAAHAQRAQAVSAEVTETLRDTRRSRNANHELHFKRATCGYEDPTYPSCNLAEVTEYHRKCDAYLDNLLLHPTKVIGEAFECIFKSIVGRTACWRQFHEAADYFESPSDFLLKFTQWHLATATLRMEVTEAIDVRVQGLVEFDMTTGMWFDIDLGVDSFVDMRPPVISWGFLVQVGGGSSLILNGGQPAVDANAKTSKDQTGWGSHANGMGKMTWGVPVIRFEQVYTAHIAANLTLPGVSAQISKGIFEFDLLKQASETFKSTVSIKLEYLRSRIDIAGDSPSFGATWSLGPAFDFSMTPGLPAGESWSDSHTHVMAPLAFGGAWELVRFDFKLGAAAADNAECLEVYGSENWKRDGWMTGFYFRTGVRLYASFFGQRIDTSWLGKLQKHTSYAIDGLYYSHRLALHCQMSKDGEGIADAISGAINHVLDGLQDPIERKVREVSEKLNSLGKDDYLPGDYVLMGFPTAQDGTAVGYEAFKDRHNLVQQGDNEVYILPARPETPEMCKAEEAGAKHYGGTGRNCSNINSNTSYNGTAKSVAFEAQESHFADSQLCKVGGIGCKSSSDQVTATASSPTETSTLLSIVAATALPTSTTSSIAISSPAALSVGPEASQEDRMQAAQVCKLGGICPSMVPHE